MPGHKTHSALVFLARVVIFTLVFAGAAEVWFRVVMRACERPLAFQASPATMLRFDSDGPNPGLWTVGRACLLAGHWRINNEGWNSAVDYLPPAERSGPLIALFGDSYVEGFLTDTNQHVDAYLPRMLPGTEAYAFGFSGWYLEQYVAASRYAQVRFAPSIIIIFIFGRDVSESLYDQGQASPLLWHLVSAGHSFSEMPPSAAYSATTRAKLASRSAVVRYLRYNAALALPGMSGGGSGQATTIEAPDQPTVIPGQSARWRALLPAADFMVNRLCEDHPNTPIIFVSHGPRYLPPDRVATTPLFPDSRAVKEACRGRSQCSFIDMRYAFSRDWATNEIRFESADKGHWNSYANRLVARVLADFIENHRLLKPEMP